MTQKLLSLYIVLLVFSACNSRPENLDAHEYIQWRKEYADDFRIMKEHTDFDVIAEYLEPQYLALLEQENTATQVNYDTLFRDYKCGLTFNISLQVRDPQLNLLQKDITSMDEYNFRVYVLSYKMNEFITLKINGENVKPALYNYEGYNELNNRINFRAVFVPGFVSCEEFETIDSMTLEYDDQIWGSGVSKFTFSNDHIADFPEVID